MKEAHFFIPVYFDAESFQLLRESIRGMALSDLKPVFHLLDDSAGLDPAVAKLAASDTRVHVMQENLGHQGALVHGLRAFLGLAQPDTLIVTMDGDGEDRPEDLPRLLLALAENPASFVLARRTSRKETLLFKACYFFYRILFLTLTGTLIRSGNFAAFRAGEARTLLSHSHFDSVYASALVALADPLVYVPCPRGARYRGQSKMGYRRLALHGLRMLLPFRARIAVRAAAFVFFLLLLALTAWLVSV